MKNIDLHKNINKNPTFKGFLFFVIIGVIYLIFVELTGYRIPCVFNLITGFDCPGCGITRMCMDIFHFDFREAFDDNPFIFATLPLLIGYLTMYYVKKAKGEVIKHGKYIEIIYIVALVLFGVVRNL